MSIPSVTTAAIRIDRNYWILEPLDQESNLFLQILFDVLQYPPNRNQYHSSEISQGAAIDIGGGNRTLTGQLRSFTVRLRR
jgi:hypothetical protein